MTDFIDNLKKNAEVFLEWCRQQKELPKEERDILEFGIDDKWYPVMDDFIPWHHDKYRLRKASKDDMAVLLLREARRLLEAASDRPIYTRDETDWIERYHKFLESQK